MIIWYSTEYIFKIIILQKKYHGKYFFIIYHIYCFILQDCAIIITESILHPGFKMKYPLLTKDRSFYKTLFLLAIPIALQNFISYGVNFMDNLMIGKLGEIDIAGVYIGNQFQTVVQLMVNGITGSLTILGAQYWGRKDTLRIRQLTAISIRCAIVLGIVFTFVALLLPRPILSLFSKDPLVLDSGVKYLTIVCWSYIFFCYSMTLVASMQAVEQVKIGLYITILALFTNVGLNYVLIFGKLGLPALGVRGAALATLISRMIESAVLTVYVCAVDKKLEFSLKSFFLNGDGLFRDLVRCGAPIMGAWIVWAINNLAQTAIMGRVGTEAVSAVSIANNLSQLLFMAVLGLAAALGIITSKTVGAGEYEKMKEYAITAQLIFLGVGIVVAGIFYLLKDTVISFYNLTEETKRITDQFMIVLVVAQVGRCYQATCLQGLVRAGGDTSFIFKNDTIFVFGVLLPSALNALYVFNAPAWVI